MSEVLERLLIEGKTRATQRRVHLATTVDMDVMAAIREMAAFFGSNPAVVARNSAMNSAIWWNENKERLIAAAAAQAAAEQTAQVVTPTAEPTQVVEQAVTETTPANDWDLVLVPVTTDVDLEASATLTTTLQQEAPTTQEEVQEPVFPTNSWTTSFETSSPANTTEQPTLREMFI